MRMPNMSKHMNAKKSDKTSIRKLNYVPDCEPKYYDLGSDDSKKKFIEYIEKKVIRPSSEYIEFMKFLKESMGMNKDGFFQDVDYNIQIHHTPFTLYDLVAIAIEKFIDHGMELDPYHISEYIMMQHYIGQVGLYPLTKTVHELVHNGLVLIPIQNVFGSELDEYMVENRQYITETQQAIIDKLVKQSNEIAQTVPDIFSINYICIDSDGKWRIPTSEE